KKCVLGTSVQPPLLEIGRKQRPPRIQITDGIRIRLPVTPIEGAGDPNGWSTARRVPENARVVHSPIIWHDPALIVLSIHYPYKGQLFFVVQANRGTRGALNPCQSRQKQRSQNADDSDHDEQFNE